MDNLIPNLILPGEEPEAVPAAEAPVVETAEAPAAQAPAAAAVQAAPVEAKAEEPAKAKVEEAPLEPVSAEEDSLNFDNLSEQEKAAVLAFVERIDIRNSETVLKYGNAAQMKISQFSDKILADVKTKDTGAISDMLTDLVAELKGFDVDEGKKGGFFGLFKKAGLNLTQLKAKFDKVEENVSAIIDTLQGHQQQLIADAQMLDDLYKQNEQYYHELTLYIIAGEIKLRRLREEELPPLLAKAQETADPADAQAASDFSQLIERFDKRIHDLKLTRMVSVQMGPQIRLMQTNDNVLAERIQSTIANTIPLWKSQMVISLGMQHAEEALSAQKAVTDMTNELLRSNAERLKVGTIETAKEAERGVVDLDTIRAANTALIETLTEVQRIQREGSQKRAQASIELGRLEKQLRDKVLEINNQ
ncbi:MAG: toxic anion resistance protein [Clostridia bacterium]|nr:toxic anion resistance protein [Clostridia bacterium]MBQ4608105.1 toxic anion resistance protein [Clostridia bacterium]MBQ6858476.1 toxic anion resistance protein [Clostridia bacterium]MBQ7052190.1 toxic anion resistance protein [Clostridia bacterium]